MTQYDKVWKWLERDSRDLFTGAHSVHTPHGISKEIISYIAPQSEEVLVLYNVEFIISLINDFDYDPELITFVSDHLSKSKLVSRMGVKYIMSIDEYTKKNPVLLINPPYTNGEKDASEIYTQILDKVIDKTDPIAIGAVTPENLINGGQKKRTLRKKILENYNFKNVNFLDQARDWNKAIEIDTISWVATKSHSGVTTVRGRFLGEEYTTDMTANHLTELANGETQEIHDWLIGIQTDKKVPLRTSKKTSNVGSQVKISKTETDSCAIENGIEFDSDNDKWRVAFGYMRCNTCAIVPPTVSVPSKYRYVVFDCEADARKFRDFMISEPVRFIMKVTYTSRTLDAPQINYVPWIDLSSFNTVDDATLYAHWKTSQDAQDVIKSIVGSEVPF